MKDEDNKIGFSKEGTSGQKSLPCLYCIVKIRRYEEKGAVNTGGGEWRRYWSDRNEMQQGKKLKINK